VRGIEARRRDTAPFIASAQMSLLEILAKVEDASQLMQVLPKAEAFAHKQLCLLKNGKVPPEELLMALKLSRELTQYSVPSPAARAVQQMEAAGKSVRPGQRVRLIFTRGEPRVHAWDAGDELDPRRIDLKRYTILFERAVQTVLEPVRQSVRGGKDEECLYLFPLPAARSWGPLGRRKS